MMRVGIVQSCYIPWRGYFDFINSVDLFIVLDDIRYPVGRSWRNRNQIKTKHGLTWLTVPVAAGSHKLSIDQVMIAKTTKPWATHQHNLLRESLGKAPFFQDALALWEAVIDAGEPTISRLNVRLIRSICSYLQIRTPLVLTETADKFDILATVAGGGVSGQAGAVRLGIARALVEYNAELRKPLKGEGMLTRDARAKERKKYGMAGARKRFQFSKR